MRDLFFATALAAALLMPACRQEESGGTRERREKNIRLAGQVYDAFNRHDWAGMAELYADTAEFKDPSFDRDIVRQTRQQIEEKYRKYGEMSPDIRDSVVAVYAAGETHVIVEFVSSGTGPDGVRWSLPICTIFTIEDGMITGDYTYYDHR